MGLIAATIRLLTNSRALDVAVVDASGNQVTSFSSVATPPANATLTTVPLSTTSAVLAPANANRKQLLISNDSGKELSVAFAATATTSAYSVVIGANNQWSGPLNGYTGVVSGILPGGTGNARVTEVTT